MLHTGLQRTQSYCPGNTFQAGCADSVCVVYFEEEVSQGRERYHFCWFERLIDKKYLIFNRNDVIIVSNTSRQNTIVRQHTHVPELKISPAVISIFKTPQPAVVLVTHE